MASVTIFAPAKLNLFLAITGRRDDGFHNLVSVVAPLTFGDTLVADTFSSSGGCPRYELSCSDAEVPCDGTNLVLRAAKAFAGESGWNGNVRFRLEKRIPMGAGMGGGSSNGAAALRALNRLAGEPLDAARLSAVAGTLGSDCPLFLHDGPVVMRGRGERVEDLPAQAACRLRGRKVLVFKPPFGIPTAWAYGRMVEEAAAAGPARPDAVYLSAPVAEGRLSGWISDANAPVETLLFNNMEAPAFSKYVALPTLLNQLREGFGLAPRMTGSGSACFALLQQDTPVNEISSIVRGAWGDAAFVVDTQFA